MFLLVFAVLLAKIFENKSDTTKNNKTKTQKYLNEKGQGDWKNMTIAR